MESSERPRVAEDVARWFASDDGPETSAHFCVDAAEAIQCVRLNDVAWHVQGANDNTIGIEHAGRASQSRDDWQDEYSLAVLRRSAPVAAYVCRRYSLPVLFVDERGLLQGLKGITTHAALSRAFRKSTHLDPGPGWPMDLYLELVAQAMRSEEDLGPIA